MPSSPRAASGDAKGDRVDERRQPAVTLRRPEAGMASRFLAAVRRSRDLHRPWVVAPDSLAAYRSYIERLETDQYLGYFVMSPEGGLAGVINVNEIVHGAFCSGYLGYYAFAPCTGRGYMRAGMRKVIARAFGVHRLHRLEANIQPDNARSRRLAASLGFRVEGFSPRYLKIRGRWRDHERWAITREEWLPGWR
jgi:[ribosomal protein S5]-alanine N-acetyltransferase